MQPFTQVAFVCSPGLRLGHLLRPLAGCLSPPWDLTDHHKLHLAIKLEVADHVILCQYVRVETVGWGYTIDTKVTCRQTYHKGIHISKAKNVEIILFWPFLQVPQVNMYTACTSVLLKSSPAAPPKVSYARAVASSMVGHWTAFWNNVVTITCEILVHWNFYFLVSQPHTNLLPQWAFRKFLAFKHLQ